MPNKSEEPINYPAGNLLAHFNRYVISSIKLGASYENRN